ncbi:uncharacterized protein LOC106478170 isoform X1 [Limulus polyphemus]|uniref:Uncharacterized protein LOC106478170 isoform X1 n=2 Tax=Limulus polyphemus TaxID=6850 RepID=A0ABM1C4S0_LIMPO|nr:uncharacterized protein LOC106478170 isoform X1 [Limulus polyphemus]
MQMEKGNCSKSGCHAWNCYIDTAKYASQGYVDVTFDVDLNCFKSYKMIFSDKERYCSDKSVWKGPLWKNVTPKNSPVQERFSNLTVGKQYYIVIRPGDEQCENCLENLSDPKCIGCVCKTSTFLLPSNGYETKYLTEPSPDVMNSNLALVLGVVLGVVALLFMVTVMVAFRRRHNLRNRGMDNRNITPESSPSAHSHLMSNLPIQNANLQVSILYSHDCLLHTQVIEALAKFLTINFGVNVLLDVEQEHEIMVNPEGWVQEFVDYSKRSNKKIIIIESEGAVKQQWARQKGENLKSTFHHLDSLFMYGLSTITSDLTKASSDYEHLLVLRFPYTPALYVLDHVVPNRRYLIPDHMLDLYHSMFHHVDSSVQNSEELLAQWQQTPAYMGLLNALKEMEDFTTANPSYMDQYLLKE